MGQRLIVDTNILIALERGDLEPGGLDDDDELAVAGVTRAELEGGPLLAKTADVARRRAQAVTAILESVESLDYTAATARFHAKLLAHTRQAGQPRGAYDLIIAAHAAETGRAVLSRDSKARFRDLPGVRLA
ncbi:PIN domain-containing protein [Myceligenerans crystallogenes]|uniref:Ribonuclease VapC n=1 Tax=Myceligenerans crystallogenes TaxID=316335 RepID=A0ABN2NJG4_9MICO